MMTATGGFYDRRTASPTSLAVVVVLHAAAIGAFALVKTEIVPTPRVITEIFDVPTPVDPPPVPPPPARVELPRNEPPPTRLDAPATVFDLPVERPAVAGPPVPPPQIPELVGAGSAGSVAEAAPRLPPLRIDAEFDPRFASALQPPYPASEQRAEREGTVRVRVTIGADGRVRTIERLSATSDAFWAATERHARARWRFRPATVDGVPVESTKTLTLHFRLEA